MTSEQKQSELQRRRAILMATLDYLIAAHGGGIVFDNVDFVVDHYEQQKLKVTAHYTQGQVNKLQRLLVQLVQGLQNRIDLNFASYIKEKTGYDIDIFEDIRKRVDAIIAQNEIRSQQEAKDVGIMLQYYQKTSPEGGELTKLKTLFNDYAEHEPNPGCVKVISTAEKDGVEVVTVELSSGPEPKHLNVQESVSPDGKRKLRVVQWSDGKNASTYVEVAFPTANGAIYGISGIHPNVKASWKNNATIVIETAKAHKANTQYQQVSSYDDVIAIEYVEY